MYMQGLIQGLLVATHVHVVLQEGKIRHVPVPFSKYTRKHLGRGYQLHGWEIPILPGF